MFPSLRIDTKGYQEGLHMAFQAFSYINIEKFLNGKAKRKEKDKNNIPKEEQTRHQSSSIGQVKADETLTRPGRVDMKVSPC